MYVFEEFEIMGEPTGQLKAIIFPGPEGNVSEKRNGFTPKIALTRPSVANEEKIKDDYPKLEFQQTQKAKRMYSCPSIVNFNATKPYQQIRPEHKPRRIFNGFFPQKIRTGNNIINSKLRMQEQEFVWEELSTEQNVPAYCHRQSPIQERAAISPVSHYSVGIRYPTPSSTPIWSRNVSPVSQPRIERQSFVSSLRNGTPSPWVNRYKLKQKSNSMLNLYDVKRKLQTQTLQPVLRVYSR